MTSNRLEPDLPCPKMKSVFFFYTNSYKAGDLPAEVKYKVQTHTKQTHRNGSIPEPRFDLMVVLQHHPCTHPFDAC